MKKDDENKAISPLEKEAQKMLDKLISDEWFAGNIYKQFVMLVAPEDRNAIAEPMLDVANDELDDHYRSLVEFALQNGYSVPTTYSEMKKCADKDDVKLFENCKKGQDALFYINNGIEAEKRAIETYEKYVDVDWLNLIPELQLIVKNNFYDEVEHLKTFEFMNTSIEAMRQFPA